MSSPANREHLSDSIVGSILLYDDGKIELLLITKTNRLSVCLKRTLRVPIR